MSENAVAATAAPKQKPSLQTWWTLIKASVSSWLDDYAPSMGAALSYYTVFSLAPLLLIVVSVAGLVFGEEAVRGELFTQLQGLMGADAAKAIQDLLASVNKPTKGIVGTQFSHGAVAFFDLQAGLKLALWPRESIAHDTGLARSEASPSDLTIAHNVRSKDEVDAVMAQAAQAGARVVKVPVPTFYGGYAGYFQDPDGHLWEVAWNPEFQV